MDDQVELEICGNCKKEIPHYNYVMHSAHCARNITLCPACKEPIPKTQFGAHKETCKPKPKPIKPAIVAPRQPPSHLEQSEYFVAQKTLQERKDAARQQQKMERMERLVDAGAPLGRYAPAPTVNGGLGGGRGGGDGGRGAIAKTPSPTPRKRDDGLTPCKYCELELPTTELGEHENYCGARTDRCGLCGELVMFKYKQLHEETNHGFLKLNDEPGPRPTWDSTSPRATTPYGGSPYSTSPYNTARSSPVRPRFVPYSAFDVYAPPYAFAPSYSSPSLAVPGGGGGVGDGGSASTEKLESSRDISRRLDSLRKTSIGSGHEYHPIITRGTTTNRPAHGKTEYIRNLLHDSAGITAPLPRSSSSGAVPRASSGVMGRGAQAPPRRNPPTELMIPCEFCEVPIPHADLVDHETICRIALPRFNVRTRRSPSPVGPYGGPPSSHDEDLPCEFCADLIPASQLLRHQATCNV